VSARQLSVSTIFSIVSLCTALEGSAQERFIEYVVVKGDTCEGIAHKLYGSPKLCYRMLAKYNKFDKKFRIEPGQVLKLPTKEELSAPEPDAELVERRGGVEARKPDDQSWFKAVLGEKLWSRWRVSTEQRSTARLAFTRDASSLELRESTLVIIYGPSANEAAAKAGGRAELERGTLRSRLGELSGKPSKLIVDTPAAQASLEGGAAIVAVEPQDGTTRVVNHTGKSVEVSGRDPVKKKVSKKRVALPVNTGSKVEPGKDPSPPKPLPPAPAWTDSAPLIVPIWGDAGVVELDWQPPSQAAVVRLELSSQESGQGLLDVQEVPGQVSRARLEGLPAGEYWARLASVDADAFEGIPGPARQIVVKSFNPQWVGRAAEAAAPLPGHALATPGVRCALGDGAPVERLVMPRAGRFEARCVDTQGHGLPPLPIEVSPVVVRLIEPAAAPAAPPGEPLRLVLSTEPALEALAVEAPEGWSVAELPGRDVQGRWVLTVVASAGARPGPLRILSGDGEVKGEVGEVGLSVGQMPPPAPVEVARPAWSVQPMWSYSALYSAGYKLGDVQLDRGWRVGLRAGRVLTPGLSLELGGFGGRLITEAGDGRVTVVGGDLGVLWRFTDGLTPFVTATTGVDMALGDDGGLLWTLGAGAGLLSPVSEVLDFRLEVREVVAPLAAEGLGLHTQLGMSLVVRF
jgi:LysM repeat protein